MVSHAINAKDMRGVIMVWRKQSKYLNTKIIIDGINFHSRKEGAYYQVLKYRKLAGDIIDFELQPKFTFPIGATYTADFKVFEKDGTECIIDVKSPATAKDKTYILKKKCLLYFYPDINFREVI